MTELWNTDRVRAELGAKTIRSASRIILRMGLTPVSREPGRSGMNLYDAAEVARAIAARPGSGRRRDTAPGFFASAPGDGVGIAEDSDRLMAEGFGRSEADRT